MISFVSELEKIYKSNQFMLMVSYLKNNFSKIINEIIKFSKIPAPSHEEDLRAYYVFDKMNRLGLKDVHIDGNKNVIGRFIGNNPIAKLVVSAHTDIAFPKNEHLNPFCLYDKIICPGIVDNSTSVIGMLTIIELWKKVNFVPPNDVIFVASSCEEGIGDLSGIKGFFSTYTNRNDVDIKYFVAIDGELGLLCNQGISSRRLKVTLSANGGNNWTDFGEPSAINTLGAIIYDISKLEVSKNPRTTYNVGTIEGGTSINTIAGHSSMTIDLRSVNQSQLQDLESKVNLIIKRRTKEYNSKYQLEIIGDRPAGFLPESHELVQLALRCSKVYKIKLNISTGSSDANIPLSRGIPAISTGICNGGGGHTLSEYIIPSSLKNGMSYILLYLITLLESLDTLN